MRGERLTRRQLLAATLLAPGCLPEGRLKIRYNDTPRDMGDGWPIATPAAVGLDPAAVQAVYERAFSEQELPGIVSLLIVRHGQLVAEGYMRDLADVVRKEHVVSVTKSITSLLVGIALERGILANMTDRVWDLLERTPDDPRKHAITLEHLATMRSALNVSNDHFAYEVEHGAGAKDALTYALTRPLATDPGTRFWYRDVDPHLMSEIIHHRLRTPLDILAQEALFTPLGISDVAWLRHRSGVTYGAFGCFLRPRDLAKLGQLVLDDGQWSARPVVPSTWIATSTSPIVTDASERGIPLHYGYWWWREPTRNAIYASGHGGQTIWIDRARSLVIVVTADPDAANNGADISLPDFLTLTAPLTSP